MPRAVLDSSVLISAFLTPKRLPSAVLDAAERGAFVLCLSPVILEETRASLLRKTKRIRRYYSYPDERIAAYIEGLAAQAELVSDLPNIRVVPNDPKDDPIVATAVAAKADYLVTGDRAHLLPIKEYAGVRIVSPREFLELL
jgi:uncharacterized protein